MKNTYALFVLSFLIFATQSVHAAAPLRCQGVLNPPADFPNYVGRVALYFNDKDSKSAKLWHQYPNGSSKTYTMSCHLQYVGDGPSTFHCSEVSDDQLKFTFAVLGSYSPTRPSGLGTSAFIGVERDGEDGRTQFVAGLGTIGCY